MSQPIGVFDSGVGGLSIWQEIVSLLPHESTIYVADSLHAPYGTKNEEEIYQLSKQVVSFLVQQKVKLIVIACNTASTTSLERLRQDFASIPIIGTVPVVKKAAEVTRNKRIGVLSTVATAKSEYQKRLIDTFAADCEVLNVGTDELVPFVEQGELTGARLEATLVGVLASFIKKKVDVIALGCTHFPFLRNSIQQLVGPHVTVLDSGAAVVRQVKRVLESNKKQETGDMDNTYLFYTTGNKEMFEKRLHQLIPKLAESKIQEVSSITI